MNKGKKVVANMWARWPDKGSCDGCFLNIRIEGNNLSILMRDIEISLDDLERLARASDGVGYLDKYLKGEEICSHTCHYPGGKQPECVCQELWDEEEREEQ